MLTRKIVVIVFLIVLYISLTLSPVYAASPIIEASSATGVISGNGTTLSVAIPSGVESGDLLVVCLAATGDDTSDMSATGWTHVETAGGGGTTNKIGMLYRFWQSGDADPAVFTISSGNNLNLRRGVMWRISGADATPSDATASSNVSSSTTSRIYNSITTNTNEALVLGCMNWFSNDSTYTPDASLTNTTTQNRHAADNYINTTAGSTGNFTGSGNNSPYVSILWAVAPGESPVNNTPTITLNSPSNAATGISTSPTLTFTGSDADDDDLIYEIQVTDNPNDFIGGSVLTDNFSGGGGGSFHPQPHPTATTWQSNIQVDDRMCQSFTASGGKWAKAVFPLGDSRVDTSGTSYARIYTHSGTYGTSSAPANAGDPLDQTTSGTPTIDWLAVSDGVSLGASFSSGDFDFAASGANQIRFEAGENYVLCSDWVPDNNLENNTWAWSGDVLNSGTLHDGNLYHDGYSAANHGVHADWDLHFEIHETFTLEDTNSTDDTGFTNTVDNGDTSPFTQGEQISYEVQTTLDEDITYYWRVRVNDGTINSNWSSTQSFTTGASSTPTPTPTPTSTPTPTPIPTSVTPSTTTSTSPASPPSEFCGNTIPSPPPNIFQIDTTATTATLNIHPAGGSVTGYTVFFGYFPGDDRFSSYFIQGFSLGAITHTIRDLQPNATYYFRAIAHNGCAVSTSSVYTSVVTSVITLPNLVPNETISDEDTPKESISEPSDQSGAEIGEQEENQHIEKEQDRTKKPSLWSRILQSTINFFKKIFEKLF